MTQDGGDILILSSRIESKQLRRLVGAYFTLGP